MKNTVVVHKILASGLGGVAFTRSFVLKLIEVKISKGQTILVNIRMKPRLYAYQHIRSGTVVTFYEIPACGLGGVAFTRFQTDAQTQCITLK